MTCEDRNTEFKRTYTETIVKTAIAFSNTNGGEISVGVDEDGSIISLDDPDGVCMRCAQDLRDRVRPDITSTSKVDVEAKGGKRIVRITVEEGPNKPYYLRDKGLRPESVYFRNGTASVPVTDDHFMQMISSQRSITYESMVSLEQGLTFDHTSCVFEGKGLPFDEERMRTLGMIDKGRYTNLAFLLSDQFDQGIKLAVFPDKSRNEFIDRMVAEGSVIEQMEQSIEFMMRFNRFGAKVVGLERHDVLAYPKEVIREAVLNAIVHMDYSVSSSILISIYPDEMAIVSPGGLRTPFSVDDLFEGVSSTRNVKLASILYKLGYIEAYGTGIPKIKHAYDLVDLAPVISFSLATFRIVLPAMDSKRKTGLDLFLSSRTAFTRSEMEAELGMSKASAIATLKILISDGKVVAVGSGRSTSYRTVRKRSHHCDASMSLSITNFLSMAARKLPSLGPAVLCIITL